MAPNNPLLVLTILDLVEAGLVGPEGLVDNAAAPLPGATPY